MKKIQDIRENRSKLSYLVESRKILLFQFIIDKTYLEIDHKKFQKIREI